MKTAKPNPIVACARGWIGTRFHHQGRLKKTENHKGGVDCLGLLAGVAAELDLRGPDGTPLTSFDETGYPHQPDTVFLREKLSRLLIEILLLPPPFGGRVGEGVSEFEALPPPASLRSAPSPRTGEGVIKPGDIVLLRIDESPQHLAIVSDFPVIPALCGDLEKQAQALPSGSGSPHEAGMTNLGLIHAYAPARAVVEHAFDDWWQEKIEAAFRVVIPA